MFVTVRTRIFTFAFLALAALAALGAISWSIIAQTSQATDSLVNQQLAESWQLTALEENLRTLQDLSYQTKAQLLLWNEVDGIYAELENGLASHWQALQVTPGLTEWATVHQQEFGQVQQLLALAEPCLHQCLDALPLGHRRLRCGDHGKFLPKNFAFIS